MDDPETAVRFPYHSLSSAEQSDIGKGWHASVVREGFKAFIDTFRRNDVTPYVPRVEQYNTRSIHVEVMELDGPWPSEPRSGGVADGGLAHALKGRHLQMIAIGGCIGTFRSV